MTDKLHNHIAAMVCETDEPGKPADVKDAIDIMADLKRLVDDEGDVLARASLRLITDLRARAEAAEARVTELTAKLEAMDGDSLDAIMETVGEGPEFAAFNKGKSAMRDWFLRRIADMIGGE